VAARLRKIGLAAIAVAALVALAAPAAGARRGLLGLFSSRCQTVFAPWGDYNLYWLAPNGGLEDGSTGWTLRYGASVVRGNEPFMNSGSHSLSLPSGSSATSPTICLGPDNPYIRFFASDAGGSDRGLHVRVTWYGLLNIVLGITDASSYDGGQTWDAQGQLRSSGGGNVLLPLLGSTSARVQFAPMGAGSNWLVDDVYVDPRINRIG
jgi:hypothetical protein